MKKTVTFNQISFTGWYKEAEKYQRSSITPPEPASFEVLEINDNSGNNITEAVDEVLEILGIDPSVLEEKLIEKITS